MPNGEGLAGRSYFRVYRTSGRGDLHDFLLKAIQESSGQLTYASDSARAPVYVTVEHGPPNALQVLGIVAYPFRCNPPPIKGRSPDEHRAQIRYGSEESWGEDHSLARDPAGVDVTLILGVHLEERIFVGLDPQLYDPLPMGISIEFKDADVRAAAHSGWHVWERENFGGLRRETARAREGIETLIAFRPERFLDYAAFEREATRLGLDPPLRYRAAEAAGDQPTTTNTRHLLEEEFELSGAEILEIVSRRRRLHIALRGGVAEYHLERLLNDDSSIRSVNPIDEDAQPDFNVQFVNGRNVRVECKNVSPKPYADGSFKVEVQKTRASMGDPASRLYRRDQFDVVAASLYPATGRWEFRFKRTSGLRSDVRWEDRIYPVQRVDETWSETLQAALAS
jgi:hypothetical protein